MKTAITILYVLLVLALLWMGYLQYQLSKIKNPTSDTGRMANGNGNGNSNGTARVIATDPNRIVYGKEVYDKTYDAVNGSRKIEIILPE